MTRETANMAPSETNPSAGSSVPETAREILSSTDATSDTSTTSSPKLQEQTSPGDNSPQDVAPGAPPLDDKTNAGSTSNDAASDSPTPNSPELDPQAIPAPPTTTTAPTSKPEVTVNFAEPPWHKERLQRLQEAGQHLAEMRKQARATVYVSVPFAVLTVLAYKYQWYSPFLVGLLIVDAILALALFSSYWAKQGAADALKNVESLARLSATLFTQKSATEQYYFESLVSINVENLREYYLLVKKHTSYSYGVSLTAGVLGFLLICGALLAGYVEGKVTSVAYVGTGAGLIVEFIAGIFFYLYNKTVRQLKGYHDSLLDVQNVLLALKLIESVTKEDIRAPMLQTMIAFLMNRRTLFSEAPVVTTPSLLQRERNIS